MESHHVTAAIAGLTGSGLVEIIRQTFAFVTRRREDLTSARLAEERLAAQTRSADAVDAHVNLHKQINDRLAKIESRLELLEHGQHDQHNRISDLETPVAPPSKHKGKKG